KRNAGIDDRRIFVIDHHRCAIDRSIEKVRSIRMLLDDLRIGRGSKMVPQPVGDIVLIPDVPYTDRLAFDVARLADAGRTPAYEAHGGSLEYLRHVDDFVSGLPGGKRARDPVNRHIGGTAAQSSGHSLGVRTSGHELHVNPFAPVEAELLGNVIAG